jgi:ABC-type polysaccharide/polyol phosphate transport system ATPase subunit
MEVRRAAMSSAIVEVRDLHKEFFLSHSGVGSLKTMLLWWKRRGIERLHVLKGLSFEVQRGESVAVVGRNGAGKSTLLALLAQVYKPTRGSIHVGGRLAPLLELGAGFHPDLTGLENVFFNGIILGLTRKEIQSRIDEIVAFSELEVHIDAPVRTYSSGMLARLGFAVAVHVDAEVLLVDEVLAVGDFQFEQKCYAKIDEFRSKGGSILFVSHQMDAVRRVADRCLWLSRGEIVAEGLPEDVIGRYAQGEAAPAEEL